jgi:hypothetical protein
MMKGCNVWSKNGWKWSKKRRCRGWKRIEKYEDDESWGDEKEKW